MILIELFVTFIIILLEYFTILNILDCYLTRFDRPRFVNSLIIIGSSVLVSIICSYITIENINTIIMTTFSVVIIPNLHFVDNFKQKIITPIISVLSILVIDYIMLNVIMSFFILDLDMVLNNGVAFIITSSVSKLTSLFLSVLLKKYLKCEQNNSNIKITELVASTCVPFTSILIIYTLIYLNLEENITNLWLLFLSMLIIISNFMFVTLTHKIENDKELCLENTRLQELVKLEYQNVQSLAEEYGNQRKLTHDFKNHLLVMQSLNKNEQVKELDEYIYNLIGTNYLDSNVLCNNAIIDAILNQKYNLAKKLDIKMDINVNDLSNIILKNKDITIILANLIDNAIEATKLCSNKYVKLKIKQTKYELIVSIENSIPRQLENNNLITSKSSSIEHGYGLKNVKSILKQYDAHLVTKNANNCYKTSFIVNV